MKYSLSKYIFPIFVAIKLMVSVLMIMFPQLLPVLCPFGIFSLVFVLAMALGDFPAFLLIILLLLIVTSIISVILFFVSLFCKKINVDFLRVVLWIFFLGEAVCLVISTVMGLLAAGITFADWKIAGILFNLAIVVMLAFIPRKNST